jgi:hypothetical protein
LIDGCFWLISDSFIAGISVVEINDEINFFVSFFIWNLHQFHESSRNNFQEDLVDNESEKIMILLHSIVVQFSRSVNFHNEKFPFTFCLEKAE